MSEFGEAGAAIYTEVTSAYDLAAHELAQLREAAETADLVREMADRIKADGLTLDGRFGVPVPHPLLSELRQSRAALAKLLAGLRIPESADDETDGKRAQRRHGFRGTYS